MPGKKIVLTLLVCLLPAASACTGDLGEATDNEQSEIAGMHFPTDWCLGLYPFYLSSFGTLTRYPSMEELEGPNHDGLGGCHFYVHTYGGAAGVAAWRDSAEARNAFPDWNAVAYYYNRYLLRDGSPEEIAAWVGVLQAGVPRSAVVAAFVDSVEASWLLGNEQFLWHLYGQILHRDPDGPGWDAWLTALNNGYPRSAAIAGFQNSMELHDFVDVRMYLYDFQALCNMFDFAGY